jgi:hypothetical protein
MHFFTVKTREVTESGLLSLSFWFVFASPVTFYLATNGLEASGLAQKIYIQGVWADRYGDLNFASETVNSILSKSISLSGNIDREKNYLYVLHDFFHGFFKIFVPIIWAAFGTWAMVKYLDFRIKVVPNKSTQLNADMADD